MTDQPTEPLIPPTPEEQAEIMELTNAMSELFTGRRADLVVSAINSQLASLGAHIPAFRAELVWDLQMAITLIEAMGDEPDFDAAMQLAHAAYPGQTWRDEPGRPH